jgi:hypothetical protein
VVPPDAEVISSVGDALSMVRAAREITIEDPTPADFDTLGAEVEQEAIEAGAAPSTLDLRIDYVADRRTLRAVATGAIGLTAGAILGRQPATRTEVEHLLADLGPAPVEPIGAYWLACGDDRVVVVDRFGDPALDVVGETIRGRRDADAELLRELTDAVRRRARNLGPARIEPGVWVISGTRLAELPSADPALAVAALAEPGAVAIIGKS